MAKNPGSVRSSQLVTTYGVGSLVAAGDESFIVAGIEDWPENERFTMHEPRLERILRVNRFMRPPYSDQDGSRDVPVRRFPRQHSCPQCHRLNDIMFFNNQFGENTCTRCEGEPRLVPSRFVVACANGHLDEFPYFGWVHQQKPHPEGEKPKLKLETRGESAGLDDVVVSCSCGARRSLHGAFGGQALQGVKRCGGKRPWLASDQAEECDLVPVALQRGASNVWFASSLSAISIPPWSDAAFKLIARHWEMLRVFPPGNWRDALENLNANKQITDEETSIEDLYQAALHRLRQEEGDGADPDVKAEEYEALMKGAVERPENHFVCIDAPDSGPTVASYFPTVKQVTKLREIRVLTGFSRLASPSGEDENGEGGNVIALPGPQLGWLPAIEVIGEGVFLDLGGSRLEAWEQRADVRARASRIGEYAPATSPHDPIMKVTPRLVLLHTLAHVLIDQWALESGYSASALRERIYCTPERAGLLIYTASSDSAGSLGGVIGMTEAGRLEASLVEAMHRASWCSADPICIESANQGVDSMNLAACHACALLPETSCELRNQVLDRGLLVGTADDPSIGYFSDLR